MVSGTSPASIASRNASGAVSIGIPNLLSSVPVVTYRWVCASTPGLIRMPTWAPYRSQFLLTFGINENAMVQRKCQLFLCLSDTGENDAIRMTAGIEGLLYFSAAYRVGSEAHVENERKESRVCIGLDGIVEGSDRAQ